MSGYEVCDGENNCGDDSDESSCGPSKDHCVSRKIIM